MHTSRDMFDNFSLLNEPRRPWIDPEVLKQKFLALSSQVHPDRVHNAPETERREADQKYSQLNTAYNCLREPKERLRHLLELELGHKPADIQNVPVAVMDSFFEVGQLCKESDRVLAEKRAISSPLLKVQWFERGQEWIDRLNAMRQKINARRDELLAELQGMNALWESGATAEKLPLQRLDEIYRLLGYFGRWSEQMQERIVQLTLD
jgi:DnaJ-domain-containing protein 1